MVDTTAGAGANAGAEGGTDNTDTSLNGEYRAGAGIYVNASGQWTDPDGNTLTGEALMNAEATASAKYGVVIETITYISKPLRKQNFVQKLH